MRVTNNMLRLDALRSLSSNANALERIQEQVSTTKQLNRPSDDPSQVRSAVKLRDALAELEQYGRNIDLASRTLDAEESAMSSSGDLLQRARELAIQGANGTLPAADRMTMAREVEQLADALAQLANTKVGETYVFSGFRTANPAYSSSGSPATYTYGGDGGAIMARIGSGVTAQSNIAGDTVFQKAFDALTQLRDELSAGMQVSGATITAIDTGQQSVLDARATVGARQARLEDTRNVLDGAVITAKKLQSELEDVDLTSAISELSSRQATYQAALAVNAKILQTSLVNYLS